MFNNTPILGVLHDIFSAKLPSRPITLSETTTAADIRGWDSMAHVRLILAIEERFGFQFSNRKLGKMTNIGNIWRMIDLIANKTSNDAS